MGAVKTAGRGREVEASVAHPDPSTNDKNDDKKTEQKQTVSGVSC